MNITRIISPKLSVLHTICCHVVRDCGGLALENWRWGRVSQDGLKRKSHQKTFDEVEKRHDLKEVYKYSGSRNDGVLHVMEQPLFIPADLHLELGAHTYLYEHAVKEKDLIGARRVIGLATTEVSSVP